MSLKGGLLAAIDDYILVANLRPDSRGLVDTLRGVRKEISDAPDPQPQGEGIISNPHASDDRRDTFRRSHATAALRAANR